MNEKEKSVLAAVEKAIGNDWHFKKLMPLARGTFGNVYELAKNNPMIGPIIERSKSFKRQKNG